MKQTNTLIIGASFSGLACAVSLQKKQVECIIIEKENRAAAPWFNHYERLHLHTSKRFSHLPYKKFAGAIPRYPSRQQVIDYLNEYQQEFNIHPFFHTKAISIRRESDQWITETTEGKFISKYLILATGPYGQPRQIHFAGMETFPGKILHSREYKSGKDFQGQNILVVGFGNSACEIAIDLYEQGAKPSMSVRSPVNVVPRDMLGLPVQELSLLLDYLPPFLADALSAPLIRWKVGDIKKLGLKKMPYGPIQEIRKDGNAPVLDIGTIQHIREGHIRIYDDIEWIEGETIHFKNQKKEIFQTIIAAIGYDRNYPELVGVDETRIEDLKWNTGRQKYFGKDGLYFCGYWISPTGQIREIAHDSKKIAKHISRMGILHGR